MPLFDETNLSPAARRVNEHRALTAKYIAEMKGQEPASIVPEGFEYQAEVDGQGQPTGRITITAFPPAREEQANGQ
jgi:hypothetical protein